MTPDPKAEELRQKLLKALDEGGSWYSYNSEDAIPALLEIVHSHAREKVEEARENFFLAVGQAKHPYIGQLRRLWIQANSPPVP